MVECRQYVPSFSGTEPNQGKDISKQYVWHSIRCWSRRSKPMHACGKSPDGYKCLPKDHVIRYGSIQFGLRLRLALHEADSGFADLCHGNYRMVFSTPSVSSRTLSMSGRCCGSRINMESINSLGEVRFSKPRTLCRQSHRTHLKALDHSLLFGCLYLPLPTAIAIEPPP